MHTKLAGIIHVWRTCSSTTLKTGMIYAFNPALLAMGNKEIIILMAAFSNQLYYFPAVSKIMWHIRTGNQKL